jgi:hypothetical protein
LRDRRSLTSLESLVAGFLYQASGSEVVEVYGKKIEFLEEPVKLQEADRGTNRCGPGLDFNLVSCNRTCRKIIEVNFSKSKKSIFRDAVPIPTLQSREQ